MCGDVSGAVEMMSVDLSRFQCTFGDVSEPVQMSVKSVDLWRCQWPCGDVSVSLEMVSVDLSVDLSVVLSSCQ